ncbi:hypothetical protein QYE76_047388 [Lolium multiflorum]|uniref:CCHC-type domain-containing protein n=1 Tax=Lolium multiflorum TaxID=4521 RepID=A0AAD8TNQ4_LOLMU|nr:hypothetical protein QYE76_047388 [Lolium multiflorum]
MTYQWESYQLGSEGNLKFEKELKQLVDYLGHPYPKFFGMPLKAKAGEPPQWDVSTDLRRKLDAPMAPPTRNNSRAQAKQIHPEHARMTEAISILAMERKALRHQHAKKDYLIARLRVKIASLERLIPVPHHAPRAKSNVTCYACGATGHYSNKCPRKATNNAPRTGSNAVPIAQTSKSTVTCYECGTVGHFSNECRKKLAKIAANPSALAQQQHHIATRRKFAPNYPNNRTGRYYHLKTAEAQEASRNMTTRPPHVYWLHLTSLDLPSLAKMNDDSGRKPCAQISPEPCRPCRARARGHALATCDADERRLPRTPWLRVEHHRRTLNPPDTVPCPRAACRRRHRRHYPAYAAADAEAMRRRPTPPDPAVTSRRTAWTC